MLRPFLKIINYYRLTLFTKMFKSPCPHIFQTHHQGLLSLVNKVKKFKNYSLEF